MILFLKLQRYHGPQHDPSQSLRSRHFYIGCFPYSVLLGSKCRDRGPLAELMP